MNYIFAVTIGTVLLKKFLAQDDFHEERIVGGRQVTINNYPFQLCLIIKSSARKQFEFRGSAVIVSTWWAFTSANNIAYMDPKLFTAGLVYLRGNATKWKTDRNHKDHTILEATVHPQYKTYARDYNLALVKVKEPFKGVHEKPIKVVGKKYKYQDKLAVTILGWGKTDVNQKGPTNILMAATVELLNQKKCDKLYSTGFISPLTQRMICASKAFRDPCTYDSGGPLIYKSDLLLGIIAWSRGCGQSSFPEIYTRVSEFYDWIRDFEAHKGISLNITFVDS